MTEERLSQSGGPAFPVLETDEHKQPYYLHIGMMLRDYYATHIPPAPHLLATGISPDVAEKLVGREPPEDKNSWEYFLFTVDMAAAFRFLMADRMLKRREQ